MASEKQIAANRRNAIKSTGPKTQSGKLRSRRNAVRHGLTAETVVTVFEDPDEYSKFEKAIIKDYQPQSTIEFHLVARIASLLWRLRRATAIQSGVLHINGLTILDQDDRAQKILEADPLAVFRALLSPQFSLANACRSEEPKGTTASLAFALAFLRLSNRDSGLLDLVLRYETTLARQLIQTTLCLASCSRTMSTRINWRPRARENIGRATRYSGPGRTVDLP